jgi:nucleoside-diphosphate-sugar epimerase
MHVLVTGGAGFVGLHTVEALWNRGHAVTAEQTDAAHQDAVQLRLQARSRNAHRLRRGA